MQLLKDQFFRLMEGGTLFVQDRQFRRLKIMGLMPGQQSKQIDI